MPATPEQVNQTLIVESIVRHVVNEPDRDTAVDKATEMMDALGLDDPIKQVVINRIDQLFARAQAQLAAARPAAGGAGGNQPPIPPVGPNPAAAQPQPVARRLPFRERAVNYLREQFLWKPGVTKAWYFGGLVVGAGTTFASYMIPFGPAIVRGIVGWGVNQAVSRIIERRYLGNTNRIIREQLTAASIDEDRARELSNEISRSMNEMLRRRGDKVQVGQYRDVIRRRVENIITDDAIRTQTITQIMAEDATFQTRKLRALNFATGMRLGSNVVALGGTLASLEGYFSGFSHVPGAPDSAAAPYDHALYWDADPIYSQVPEVGPNKSSLWGLAEAKAMDNMGLNAKNGADVVKFHNWANLNAGTISPMLERYSEITRAANVPGLVEGDLIKHFAPINTPGITYSRNVIFAGLPTLK